MVGRWGMGGSCAEHCLVGNQSMWGHAAGLFLESTNENIGSADKYFLWGVVIIFGLRDPYPANPVTLYNENITFLT